MTSSPGLSTPALVGAILGLALVGGGLIAIVWEALNRLLSLRVDGTLLMLAVPALILVALLLRFNARLVERWDRGNGH